MVYQYENRYKCNLCGTEWNHIWNEDPSNDYTICPECNECDFEEIPLDREIKIVHTITKGEK